MNDIFSNVLKTDGVIGVVLLDPHGECVADSLPAPYEAILIAEVVKRLWTTFDMFASVEPGGVASCSVDCEGGALVLRRVDSFTLVTLARTDVNMNTLNVALNVAALKLSRRGQSASGMHALDSSSRIRADVHMGSAMTLSSESWIQAAHDVVAAVFVGQLLQIFCECAGAHANLIFDEQLDALGVTAQTLRRAQFNDFVTRLAGKISSSTRQREFFGGVSQLQLRAAV